MCTVRGTAAWLVDLQLTSSSLSPFHNANAGVLEVMREKGAPKYLPGDYGYKPSVQLQL